MPKHKIENGVVTEIEIPSKWKNASNLWPLQALVGRKVLRCKDSDLGDLSSLKGMVLDYLDCRVTKVSDLSPLKHMKLTQLICSHTQVTDLSPLREMPLDCGDSY